MAGRMRREHVGRARWTGRGMREEGKRTQRLLREGGRRRGGEREEGIGGSNGIEARGREATMLVPAAVL